MTRIGRSVGTRRRLPLIRAVALAAVCAAMTRPWCAAAQPDRAPLLSIEKWFSMPGGIHGICLSPGDHPLLYVGYGGHPEGAPVDVLDATTGGLLRRFPYGEFNSHADVVLSANGRRLFTTHYYFRHVSAIDLTRTDTDIEIRQPASRTVAEVWAGAIALSPDKKTLVVAVGRDGRNYDMENDRLSVFDVDRGRFDLVKEIPLPDEHRGMNIPFSADGRRVYIPTYPRKSPHPRLYEISLDGDGAVSRFVEFPGARLECAAVCPKAGKAFVSDSAGKKVWIVSLDTFRPAGEIAFHAAPTMVKVDPTGGALFVLTPTIRALHMADIASGRVVETLRGLRKSAGDIEFSEDGGRIYVSHGGGESYGICVVRRQRAADGGAPARAIVFSSDRDGNYQIYRMAGDGSAVVRLTENDATEATPRWSPDGRRIAFISDRDGPFRIVVMAADGSGPRTLAATDPPDPVDNSDISGAPLDWSPDGKRIAFVNETRTAVRVVNADGTGLRTLVSGTLEKVYGRYTGLCWGSDNRIYFSVQSPDSAYAQEIFSADAETGATVRLTAEPDHPSHRVAPALSPDGKTLLFIKQSFLETTPRNIFARSLADGTVRRLTFSAQVDGAPRWSADGTRIVFSSGPLSCKHVWIMNADGSGQFQLTGGEGDEMAPDIR